MSANQIALISRTSQLSSDDLAAGASAIQTQLASHFCPAWSINATIAWFPSYCPAGYTPIFIQDSIGAPTGYTGFHTTDQGFPYALVEYGPTWTLTASHECLEMVIDPDGMQVVNAPMLSDSGTTVRYLKEICDPCQSAACAYPIGQFLVSDFCLPEYFDATSPKGGKYSWNDNLTEPWQILDGGTLSWLDAGNNLFQIDNSNGNLSTVDLGAYSLTSLSRREFVHTRGHSYNMLSHADNEIAELFEKLRRLNIKLTIEAKAKHLHIVSDIERRNSTSQLSAR
jgi:hypothetical protein